MAKTEAAERMDLILAEIVPFLREFGYRKKPGRTFNRILDSGIVHVIAFQMGRYDLSPYKDISPFRHDLHGSFTTNVGIFLPVVHAALSRPPIGESIKEYDSEIRTRLGLLSTGAQDRWWNLGADAAEIARDVISLLREYALPHLDRFLSYEDVLQQWEHTDPDQRYLAPERLHAIAVLAHTGDRARAAHLMQQEYDEVVRTRGHSLSFLQEVAQRLELEIVT